MTARKALLALLVLLLSAVGCRAEEPAEDGVFALQTLHRSTASRLQDEATSTAMLFAEGTRAVIAENLWDMRRLYLADLEAGTVSEIEIPTAKPLAISEFLHAGDAVYAIFYESNPMTYVAYRVGSSGEIQPVRFLEYITVRTTEEPVGADEITPLLDAGQLERLIELQKEICKQDPATGEMQSTRLSLVHHFVNDEYLLKSNISTMKETLRAHSDRTIADGCVSNQRSLPGGLRLELTRSNTHGDAHRSELDGRIISARLYREDALLHEYQFSERSDFYFWALPVGTRLYFVGNHVKYLDLAQLP